MSSLKDRLYNYEQAPPATAWDKIAVALDESQLADEFPSKLYNAEIAPPAAAWDKITASLNEEGPKVVQMQKRGLAFYKYAAAVAIIGLLTFGILKWTGNQDTSATDGVAISTEHPAIEEKSPATPDENNSVVIEERVNNTEEDNSAHIAATAPASSARMKKVKETYAIAENIAPTTAIYAYNEHTPNLADRYVMLMTPNGIVRMSKKLGNMVCCVAGEEQDEECKDQIKKWQEKLATSPVNPAPGNFMDILSLLSSLNENEL